jgi:hypothetical protein
MVPGAEVCCGDMRSFVVVLALVACGGKTEESVVDAASTDSATSDVATGEVQGTDTSTADAANADAALACFGDAGTVPSVPFKVCSGAGGCIIITHQVDCCGNEVFVGVHKDQKAAFEACEQAHRDALPKCGCPAGPTKSEDGLTPAFPVVSCTNFTSGGGVCMTSGA